MKVRELTAAKIEINEERCKGCKLCVDSCPKKCIKTSSVSNLIGYFPAEFIDNGACTGCAVCRVVCPDLAIEVTRFDHDKSGMNIMPAASGSQKLAKECKL